MAKKPQPPTREPPTREQRLAARLRENLQRRKAQARALAGREGPNPVSRPPHGEGSSQKPPEKLGPAAANQGACALPRLILVRHGQSRWNLENRFTGWWDVDLTEQGEEEARAAGRLLAEKDMLPTVAFTSFQTRAIRTLHLALEAAGRLWIPEIKDWRLNERHYGGLTGLDKAETAARHGDEQVRIWRRSFDTPPPVLEAGSAFDLGRDARYAGIAIPATESLKDTIARVLPYYESAIAPQLAAGETVLIAAHGNSLRALVKHLSNIPDDEITGLEIPTGQPIVYQLDSGLNAVERYYLSER
jgi:2,3-bisphosphoglycerate-dependent phosphoglycerate mutase